MIRLISKCGVPATIMVALKVSLHIPLLLIDDRHWVRLGISRPSFPDVCRFETTVHNISRRIVGRTKRLQPLHPLEPLWCVRPHLPALAGESQRLERIKSLLIAHDSHRIVTVARISAFPRPSARRVCPGLSSASLFCGNIPFRLSRDLFALPATIRPGTKQE